jgi:hypothetical protein
VWVHAARALGRLTGSIEQLEGTLLDWVIGESPVLRQRAITAFASLPAERLKLPRQPAGGRSSTRRTKTRGCSRPSPPPRRTCSSSAATSGTGSPHASRTATAAPSRRARSPAASRRSGGAAPWRRDRAAPARAARAARRALGRARRARRWIEVIAVTDIVDGAERDPLDLELGLENLMRLAASTTTKRRTRARRASPARSRPPSRRPAASRSKTGARASAPRRSTPRGLRARVRAAPLGPALGDRPEAMPIEEPDLEEPGRPSRGARARSSTW